jgi:hypothetical protein
LALGVYKTGQNTLGLILPNALVLIAKCTRLLVFCKSTGIKPYLCGHY